MASLIEAPLSRRAVSPALLALVLALIAAIETVWLLSLRLPASQWAMLLQAHPVDLQAVVVRYAILPRLAVALMSGAALGLSGLIFQYVLRNPVAEPTTLGVAAGASLALTLAAIWFPWMLAFGREWVALGGALAAVALVLAIAWGRALSPLTLILAGLVVTLCAGSISSVMQLIFGESLISIFIWQSGALNQNDWSTVHFLLPRLAGGFVLAGLLARPLAMLEMGDVTARSLGLPVRAIRGAAMVLGAALAACVVSAVGILGFIGLAGPALARLTGARTLAARLVWAPVLSACLLWIADQTVQLAGTITTEVPTGTATALLGGPLLLWLLPRLKSETLASPDLAHRVTARGAHAWQVIVCVALLAVCAWLSLDFNHDTAGWRFASLDALRPLLPLRAPRMAGALAAGAMLAVAGVLMQRMTANPMASPEILGISSGASLGLVLLLLFVASPDKFAQLAAAFAGSLATLSLMFALGRRNGFSPERLVLAGIAVTTVFSGFASLLMMSGDPRMQILQSWLAGSTYRVEPLDALVAIAVAVAGCLVLPLFTRSLDMLPLGDGTARALGVDVARQRKLMLMLTAVLTAAATLIVGPISFVGLMGPHLAQLLGFRRPVPQALGGALVGALLLVIADWLGRNVLFPYQVPAGLFATFIGGPYFLVLMWRQRS
ncbi:Fe(3+)-hydroxamate ABC transporter permease FhuB [Burkholderia sp. Ac-20379]|uniref:Fe(3+)-hydroxamate ABC transporter permease FhuB n=1 Tax=Burkholderia sp. Ac-20379 TaxID=2703900 RepID=UPI001981DA88|nr:Fe(3+)-hydroxamate ABC transporter permease FhuB [Burkholderia sp. Ac-20379]MBN3724637.1 Fe(3+)-hydroxamate ABC transporter permease FhuB [Burkholderia sp. Ac-20379]